MDSTKWNGERKLDLLSMLAFSTKPQNVTFGPFSFQIQNPSQESKIDKICISVTEAVFGPKNSMTK